MRDTGRSPGRCGRSLTIRLQAHPGRFVTQVSVDPDELYCRQHLVQPPQHQRGCQFCRLENPTRRRPAHLTHTVRCQRVDRPRSGAGESCAARWTWTYLAKSSAGHLRHLVQTSATGRPNLHLTSSVDEASIALRRPGSACRGGQTCLAIRPECDTRVHAAGRRRALVGWPGVDKLHVVSKIRSLCLGGSLSAVCG